MGYENQLANERQTNVLQTRIDQLANGVQTGFATVGYENQKQTCDIQQTIREESQATRALLTGHWQDETSRALQDAKFEISQLKQNQTLINALNNGCGCGC